MHDEEETKMGESERARKGTTINSTNERYPMPYKFSPCVCVCACIVLSNLSFPPFLVLSVGQDLIEDYY